MKMQEHDATLEIISPHCHTTLMQYEEETQICSPTPTNQNQNYFWQMNAV